MPTSRRSLIQRLVQTQGLASIPLEQLDREFVAGPWKLTLSNLVRGADAAAQIAAVSDQNAAPPADIDYVLFQVNATNTGQESIWIDFDDFAMVGAAGVVHRSLQLIPPDPMLRATVEPGASTSAGCRERSKPASRPR